VVEAGWDGGGYLRRRTWRTVDGHRVRLLARSGRTPATTTIFYHHCFSHTLGRRSGRDLRTRWTATFGALEPVHISGLVKSTFQRSRTVRSNLFIGTFILSLYVRSGFVDCSLTWSRREVETWHPICLNFKKASSPDLVYTHGSI
jgi:hypothetical protein